MTGAQVSDNSTLQRIAQSLTSPSWLLLRREGGDNGGRNTVALHGPWYDAIIYCRGCQANDTQRVWVMCLMRGARLEAQSRFFLLSFV